MDIVILSGKPDRNIDGTACHSTVTTRTMSHTATNMLFKADDPVRDQIHKLLDQGDRVHYVTHSGYGQMVMDSIVGQLKAHKATEVLIHGSAPDMFKIIIVSRLLEV